MDIEPTVSTEIALSLLSVPAQGLEKTPLTEIPELNGASGYRTIEQALITTISHFLRRAGLSLIGDTSNN